MSVSGVLSSPESPPTALARALSKAFGEAWVGWEPIVLWTEIKEDTGVDLSRAHKDAIMAIRLCMTTNLPWTDWRPFLATVKALNGNEVNPQVVSPLSLSDLAYGIDLMRRLKPSQEFSDEVMSMAGITVWDHGACWIPQAQLGEIVNEYLLSQQETEDQRELLTILAKDYYSDDGLDAMDDVDLVRMHTIKLKSLDLYIGMKRKAEEVV